MKKNYRAKIAAMLTIATVYISGCYNGQRENLDSNMSLAFMGELKKSTRKDIDILANAEAKQADLIENLNADSTAYTWDVILNWNYKYKDAVKSMSWDKAVDRLPWNYWLLGNNEYGPWHIINVTKSTDPNWNAGDDPKYTSVVNGCSITWQAGIIWGLLVGLDQVYALDTFWNQCDWHDMCYNSGLAAYGFGSKDCNKKFYEDMKSNCKSRYPWWMIFSKSKCYYNAWLVYLAVEMAASIYFNAPACENKSLKMGPKNFDEGNDTITCSTHEYYKGFDDDARRTQRIERLTKQFEILGLDFQQYFNTPTVFDGSLYNFVNHNNQCDDIADYAKDDHKILQANQTASIKKLWGQSGYYVRNAFFDPNNEPPYCHLERKNYSEFGTRYLGKLDGKHDSYLHWRARDLWWHLVKNFFPQRYAEETDSFLETNIDSAISGSNSVFCDTCKTDRYYHHERGNWYTIWHEELNRVSKEKTIAEHSAYWSAYLPALN